MAVVNMSKHLTQKENTTGEVRVPAKHEPVIVSTELHAKTLVMQEICIHAMQASATARKAAISCGHSRNIKS